MDGRPIGIGLLGEAMTTASDTMAARPACFTSSTHVLTSGPSRRWRPLGMADILWHLV